MRARSSTGWTSGAATYDSGLVAHNLNRPAPRCSALLSGLVLDSHLVPSPVAFSRSQTAHGYRTWPGTASSNARYPQHNHARYDAPGQLAAEYSTATTTSPCTTCYLVWDHLGSARLITDQNAAIVARHDYLPFGEEIPANMAGRNDQFGPGNDNINQKFTAKERDTESGLDYFGARYYGSALGRFTTADPSPDGVAIGDPQSWNLYSYVR